jgi:glucose-1-phosphate cytidylyltransferase
VTLVDTGENTMTGGRIKRVHKYVKGETFMMTYGDGVSDIDIQALLEFHQSHKCTATLTAVRPQGRFGILDFGDDITVRSFKEKVEDHEAWVNGGFFVLEPPIFDLIEDDSTIFERTPLESLASSEHLKAFKHKGFWYPMDKLSDKIHLENLWNNGNASWNLWSGDTYDQSHILDIMPDIRDSHSLQAVGKKLR